MLTDKWSVMLWAQLRLEGEVMVRNAQSTDGAYGGGRAAPQEGGGFERAGGGTFALRVQWN